MGLKEMDFEREFPGPNYGYVLELYDRYRENPDSVDEATRSLFDQWRPTDQEPAVQASVDLTKLIGVVHLAQAIRSHGYLAANLDPLAGHATSDPTLSLAFHGLNEDDLRAMPVQLVGLPAHRQAENAAQAIEILRSIYSGPSGYDYGQIHNPDERVWLQEASETGRFRPDASPTDRKKLLERLSQVEALEIFLNRIYPGKTRFSIEGLEMLVPMLDEIVGAAVRANICAILIGMAHRGRLNVLAHVLQNRTSKSWRSSVIRRGGPPRGMNWAGLGM